MNHSKYIKAILYVFMSLMFTSFVSAANILDQVLRPFAGINLGSTYLTYHVFIDAVLFIVLFMGIAKAALKSQGEQFNRVGTILGIILGIGMAVFEYQTGFNLSKITFIPALIFLVVFATSMFNLFHTLFEDQSLAFALSYLIFYGMLTTAFSAVLVWINKAVPILSALLAIAALVSAIMIVVRLIKSLKGEKTTDSEPGFLSKMFNRNKDKDDDTERPTRPITPSSTSRPPGAKPAPSPKARHPTDPPTDPRYVPSGIPSGPAPKPSVPYNPTGPKIPDEKYLFIDLSPQFNPIRSQDSLGACTAFASTAAFEHLLSNFYGMPKKYLSPLYQYYKTRESAGSVSSDSGAHTPSAAAILQSNGVCFEELWTFEPKGTGKWSKHPPAIADSDASAKKVVNILRVDKNDPDQFVHALAEKTPLLIAVDWPDDIPNNASFYHNPSPDVRGGHAVVIVGYHSHYPYTPANGKTYGIKAFKIRNSWDVTWGENGYIWISAETLLKILKYDPMIFKGHKGEDQTNTFSVVGRVVFDKKIPPEITGAKIFSSNDFPNLLSDSEESYGVGAAMIPIDDNSQVLRNSDLPNHTDNHKEMSYIVGAMAQIDGKLKTLKEVNVKEKSGIFALEFRENPAKFEKLTALKSDFSKQFSQIDFSKLPPGIVIYQRHPEGKPDEWYFHIVDFKYSFGGRGGEGARDTKNPASHLNNKSLNHSGIPIVFNNQHTKEINIIIPVFDYHKQH